MSAHPGIDWLHRLNPDEGLENPAGLLPPPPRLRDPQQAAESDRRRFTVKNKNREQFSAASSK